MQIILIRRRFSASGKRAIRSARAGWLKNAPEYDAYPEATIISYHLSITNGVCSQVPGKPDGAIHLKGTPSRSSTLLFSRRVGIDKTQFSLPPPTDYVP